MILLLCATLAQAGGYYFPEDLARDSKVFGHASDVAGKAFEDHDNRSQQLADALKAYGLALDLLGTRAPQAERDRFIDLNKTFNRQFAVLQAFANDATDRFDKAFEDSLARALKSEPGAVECQGQIPAGRALPGMPAPTAKNPACKGDDLNMKIAGIMDADPALKAAVDAVLKDPWPSVDLATVAEAPVGGGDRSVRVDLLVQAVAKNALATIDAADADARLPLESDVEEHASKEQLAKDVVTSKQIDATTAAKRAALAGPILDASGDVAAKWTKKGEPTTGWCANPTVLGGCTGTDATKDLVPRLAAEKKVQAAVK